MPFYLYQVYNIAQIRHRTQILKKDRMGPLAEYALMYRQLGRTDVFRSDYCKTKAAAAHKRWFASASSSSPSPSPARGGGVSTGGGTGNGLARWLPSFLEYLQVRVSVVAWRLGCVTKGLRHE